jgi:hypothetical protein
MLLRRVPILFTLPRGSFCGVSQFGEELLFGFLAAESVDDDSRRTWACAEELLDLAKMLSLLIGAASAYLRCVANGCVYFTTPNTLILNLAAPRYSSDRLNNDPPSRRSSEGFHGGCWPLS